MIEIGTTTVCSAKKNLDKISSHLNSLSVKKGDRAVTENDLIIANTELEHHKERIIVISAVSYFEQEVYAIIKNTYKTNKNSTLEKFITSVTKRKYYQLFNISSGTKNIHNFYGLFGDKFKEHCIKREKDDGMSESVGSFLLLNRLRGRLAHESYDHYIGGSYEKLYGDFEESCKMLNWFANLINEFEKGGKKSD